MTVQNNKDARRVARVISSDIFISTWSNSIKRTISEILPDEEIYIMSWNVDVKSAYRGSGIRKTGGSFGAFFISNKRFYYSDKNTELTFPLEDILTVATREASERMTDGGGISFLTSELDIIICFGFDTDVALARNIVINIAANAACAIQKTDAGVPQAPQIVECAGCAATVIVHPSIIAKCEYCGRHAQLQAQAPPQVVVLKRSNTNEPKNHQDSSPPKRKSKVGLVFTFVVIAFAALAFIIWPNSQGIFSFSDEVNYDTFRRIVNHPNIDAVASFQNSDSIFNARIETEVFSITFENGETREFIAAVIAGNPRQFLLEVGELRQVPQRGEVARFTGRVLVRISTEPTEDKTRLTGIVDHISHERVLREANYLHVLIDNVELPRGDSAYISATGDFVITFVDAFYVFARSGSAQRYVLMIYYDYEALTNHDALWQPLRSDFRDSFVVYNRNEQLASWTHGIPADSYRGFLASQSLQRGDVLYVRSAFSAPLDLEVIRIVRYDESFNVIFSYEMAVRQNAE